MAQNKAQYQGGLSMLEFFDRYGSPAQLRAMRVRCLRLSATLMLSRQSAVAALMRHSHERD